MTVLCTRQLYFFPLDKYAYCTLLHTLRKNFARPGSLCTYVRENNFYHSFHIASTAQADEASSEPAEAAASVAASSEETV